MQHAPPGGSQQTDAASDLQQGTWLGNFQITEYVAAGGMGFIYRGWQPALQRVVAIKVMREQLRRDEAAVKRFQREARTISQLHHENTISIIDFGTSDHGFLYIVMEWLEGSDLGQHLTLRGPLEPVLVVRVATDVARALAEAHDKGIVHRDLKPENIFLAEVGEAQPRTKVLDFGIAKIVDGPAQTQITRMGMVCGTPDFMSPEQARGEELDGRSDVYALGCVIYTMLTGQMPLPADSPVGVVMRHQLDPLPRLPEWLPSDLDAIVQKATQKKREERFANADDFATALTTFAARFDVGAWEEDLADVGGATMPMPPMVMPAQSHEEVELGEAATAMIELPENLPPEPTPPPISQVPTAIGPSHVPPRQTPNVVPPQPAYGYGYGYAPQPTVTQASSGGAPGWLIGLIVALTVMLVGLVVTFLFLVGAGDDKAPAKDERVGAEAETEAPDETTAPEVKLTTVVLNSKPEGATIIGPEGEVLGKAPQTITSTEKIDAVYSAELPGHTTLKRWVKAEAGTRTSLVLELENKPVVLCVVSSDPKGAEVVAGGEVLGMTPLLVEVTQDGTLEVEVRAKKHASKAATVKGAKPCDIDIKLHPSR